MAKRLFKILGLRRGTSLERTVAIKATICTDYMQVGNQPISMVLLNIVNNYSCVKIHLFVLAVIHDVPIVLLPHGWLKSKADSYLKR